MEISPKDTFAALGCKDGSIYLLGIPEMKTLHCFKRIHTGNTWLYSSWRIY